jgi:hypothetical protein
MSIPPERYRGSQGTRFQSAFSVESTLEAPKGYVVDPQYADELRGAWIARGLSNYAVGRASLDDVEAALSAATKAYSVYPLPFICTTPRAFSK